MKGVPAAALAYHNPRGALVDDTKIASNEEAAMDVGQGEVSDGGAADGRGGVNGNTAGVEESDGGAGSTGAGSSRFRYHPPCRKGVGT